jgi:hypothetical protein
MRKGIPAFAAASICERKRRPGPGLPKLSPELLYQVNGTLAPSNATDVPKHRHARLHLGQAQN